MLWFECIQNDTINQSASSYCVIEVRKFLVSKLDNCSNSASLLLLLDHVSCLLDDLALCLFFISSDQHLLNSELLVDMITVYMNSCLLIMNQYHQQYSNQGAMDSGAETADIYPCRTVADLLMRHLLQPWRSGVYVVNEYNIVPLCHVLLALHKHCTSSTLQLLAVVRTVGCILCVPVQVCVCRSVWERRRGVRRTPGGAAAWTDSSNCRRSSCCVQGGCLQ